MKKKLKELLSLERASVLFISLPYFTFNYEHIANSPFFSLPQLLLIIIGLCAIDLSVKWLINFLTNKKAQLFSILIIYFVILFFYGVYISDYFQKIINNQFNIMIRGRSIIEISILFFLGFIIAIRKYSFYYKYLNIFFLFFSITTLAHSIQTKKQKPPLAFKNNYIKVAKTDTSNKPVILIITDEYNSPDGLYKVLKDSSIYLFSNQLSEQGWIVNNSFYSYEKSTIHSLSSMFNYNLSKKYNYGTQEVVDIGSSKLMHAAIADSFTKKDINIINFGIFHIGKSQFLTNMYMYSQNFVEDVFFNTIYYKLHNNKIKVSGFAKSYYPSEPHNKYIFNNLLDTLKQSKQQKIFAYVHLLLPHSPFQFMPEFQLRSENNIINYYAFWNFTNKKLKPLLGQLINGNKYRIILTGDHGFRNDKRINPHYTFTAFYGFEKNSLDSLKSVQDLGSLVYGSY
jgi:hypothetical protein